MALPRLALATQDTREIARVLRGALRLRTEIVSLVTAPAGTGHHLLDIEVPSFGRVTLLAEPVGVPRSEGVPLSIRPVTRVQMAELFSLIERLDEPSRSDPPPPEHDDEPPPGSDIPAEDTMIDAIASRVVLPPSHIGLLDTLAPAAGVDVEILPGRPSSVPERTTRPDHGAAPPARSVAPPSVSSERAPSRAPSRAPASSSPKPQDPRVGRLLAGKYLIELPIGSGAAATVYRAMHRDLRRPVAVKILHAENQSEQQFIRRFKAEALTASKLEHANVTRIIDFGQENGELYLVMELVVGRSLDAILATDGPLPAKRVIDIAIQVCRALVFAHGQGVIHRDIKPENVMIVADSDDDGEPCDLVKVCDFGLAKLRDPADGESSDITLSGMLCGSPAYMSPEQTRGDVLDARSDLYSLGVTMFEALTGVFPYEAMSITELFQKKCTETPRRASMFAPGLDPLLDDIIHRAMAIDPRTRHDSARELRTELRTARDHLIQDEREHNTIHGG